MAQRIETWPGVQAVLPFEPYYKLEGRLLALAVDKQLSPYGELDVVSFPQEGERARQELEQAGVEVVRTRDRTVLGDVLVVKAPAEGLAAVAQLACVQMIAVHAEKKPLNDLSRVKLRISTNTITGRRKVITRPQCRAVRAI